MVQSNAIMLTNIILVIILLHLVVGFGWLAYKLSPREGDELIDNYDTKDSEENANH